VKLNHRATKSLPKKTSVNKLAGDRLTTDDYFRIRDFEYVQPLYDLAFLLEVGALSSGQEVPKYRTFSLWRAGYSLDGYGTTIDRWLEGSSGDSDLDYVPSSRIRQYLNNVRTRGTIPELRAYRSERFARCLRLRSVRGLGPSQIALTTSSRSLNEEWFNQAAINLSLQRDRITKLYNGQHFGPWQTAHVVPPVLRFLNGIQESLGKTVSWDVAGIIDPFEPIVTPVEITSNATTDSLAMAIEKTLKRQKLFSRDIVQNGSGYRLKHQMGWSFLLRASQKGSLIATKDIPDLVDLFDPFGGDEKTELSSDLHLHTAWSDGGASVNSMASAVAKRGLKYFAVTDHSRSSKLQGGLTPVLWLRQANALALAAPVCQILHGIEVDILKDGSLDMPSSLLAAADLVIGSVHTNWSDDPHENTQRILRAIESGYVDIIAHPSSMLVGKPGVPDYVRPPAELYWDYIFETCALWRVAVEFNCFPSRLDLPLSLLKRAISAGCAISLGSDAHARSHLMNLRFGEMALQRLSPNVVLNRLSYNELTEWIRESRAKRLGLSKTAGAMTQQEFSLGAPVRRSMRIGARIQPPQNIPAGSKTIGIDLTAGNKATGLALLTDLTVETCSLTSDEEILAYIKAHEPKTVSIDSPLGLPGGGSTVDRTAGIVRVAEYDLASVGIPAYPALIESMENLTLRGIRLRQAIEQFDKAPRVIESYPGAAQDILCIPRKQKSLDLLREGLRRLGLTGTGLETRSHDEMDAITSAIVGRYYESGLFEPMGIPSEAQLIIPKTRPLVFDVNPVICLAGKTGAGKSVVARYLSVFYGFEWVHTRNVIRELLLEDLSLAKSERMFKEEIAPGGITEKHLREFGAIVLDVYKQIPLRRMLSRIILRHDAPVVVDSIRDTADVDREIVRDRPVIIWFVDCNDSVLQQRLAEKTKSGEARLKTPSPVDRTAPAIRRAADEVIGNSGSLEELRWRIDDTLFDVLEIGGSLKA
jgi:histidinol phosphatase-like PHP family hydrolase/predicted nuclease with RNAse H fold/dephospho-CoA kinase